MEDIAVKFAVKSNLLHLKKMYGFEQITFALPISRQCLLKYMADKTAGTDTFGRNM